MKELRVILRYSANSFEQTLSNLPVFFIFLFSKIVRYSLFAIFISSLFSGINPVAGFTGPQMLMFYLILAFAVFLSIRLMIEAGFRYRAVFVKFW